MINIIKNMQQGDRIGVSILNIDYTQPVYLALYENKNWVMNEIKIIVKEENITAVMDDISYITFTYNDLKEHLSKDLLFAELFYFNK